MQGAHGHGHTPSVDKHAVHQALRRVWADDTYNSNPNLTRTHHSKQSAAAKEEKSETTAFWLCCSYVQQSVALVAHMFLDRGRVDVLLQVLPHHEPGPSRLALQRRLAVGACGREGGGQETMSTQ